MMRGEPREADGETEPMADTLLMTNEVVWICSCSENIEPPRTECTAAAGSCRADTCLTARFTAFNQLGENKEADLRTVCPRA